MWYQMVGSLVGINSYNNRIIVLKHLKYQTIFCIYRGMYSAIWKHDTYIPVGFHKLVRMYSCNLDNNQFLVIYNMIIIPIKTICYFRLLNKYFIHLGITCKFCFYHILIIDVHNLLFHIIQMFISEGIFIEKRFLLF